MILLIKRNNLVQPSHNFLLHYILTGEFSTDCPMFTFKLVYHIVQSNELSSASALNGCIFSGQFPYFVQAFWQLPCLWAGPSAILYIRFLSTFQKSSITAKITSTNGIFPQMLQIIGCTSYTTQLPPITSLKCPSVYYC